MSWGLPKLPGFTFSDPTKNRFHLKGSLRYYQGYAFRDTANLRAPGGEFTDVDSNAFGATEDSVNYDPSLTYGRVKQQALPAVIPHFVHYDKRCLNFTAFMKQPVYDNPDEAYRIRVCNILYFLEDDTMTVIEPRVPNSGIWQGKMVQRDKIPKNDLGDFYTWKDLDVGKDICIYGKVFHTVSCDLYTKEWLASQGMELSKEEDLPEDPYMKKKHWQSVRPPRRPASNTDTLRRFLEYDGKMLTFNCVWDNRDAPDGEMEEFKLFYFLQDNTIAIKELHDTRGGKDPFPMLLKRVKVPKNWKERPVSFPSCVLEVTDEEVTQYYSPSDLIIGQTLFIFGRRILLVDCDKFTRTYYRSMLDIDQPPRVEWKKETKQDFKLKLPPHINIGSPEDSLSSCYHLIPRPPHKDVIKFCLNASKNLRYLCELDWVHPEDRGRRFVMSYNLGDGTIGINEIRRRNSGIVEGKFLRPMLLQTPESDPNFPTYYTPDRFYIGGLVYVLKHRFKIVGCDLFVYRYMCANPEKFPQECIDNVRNYHLREGNIKHEIEDALREDQIAERRAEIDRIGQEAVLVPTPMEKCLQALDVDEGAATTRPPSPPKDNISNLSYDDALREIRASKPVCDGVQPLKGILKSGETKGDHQKVVCFAGPEVTACRPQEPKIEYAAGQQPLYNTEEDYCDRFKDRGATERAEMRAKDICPYDLVPSAADAKKMDEAKEADRVVGHLESHGIDCKEVPDYMRITPEDYTRVKALRTDQPEVSPEVGRLQQLPAGEKPRLEDCIGPPLERPDPCVPRRENVSFACPRLEPGLPCCDPYSRDQ